MNKISVELSIEEKERSKMTYLELKQWIESLSVQQQQMQTTILRACENEFYDISATGINEIEPEDLDYYSEIEPNQPYICIE